MNTVLIRASSAGDIEVPPRDTMAVRGGNRTAALPGDAGTGAGGASGFGAAMSAVRANAGMTAPGGRRLSPEQMFDTPSDDSNQRRSDTLHEDYRKDVTREAEALREERSGLEVRKASRTDSSGGAHEAPQTKNNATFFPAATDATKAAALSNSKAQGWESDLRSGRGAAATSATPGTSATADEDGRFMGRLSDKSTPAADGTPASTTSTPPGAAPTEMAPGPPAAPVNAAPGNTAAGEVAKLLASANPTDVESFAPLSATSSSGGAPSPARETSENSRAEPNPSEQSSGSRQGAKKTEDAAETPFAQLVRLMRSQAGRRSSARLMLEPPELGRIHVRVKMLGDRVEVGVETETAAAGDLISGRAEKLRAALQHHGVVVDRLDINTNPAGLLFDPRQAVGGGSDYSAQTGRQGHASGPPARSRSDNTRTIAGIRPARAGVVEWSAAGDARLDIRV